MDQTKQVLITAIGRTDPIRGMYDGPILHIIRHYKPRYAYILYTEELYKDYMGDKRMGKTIELLCEKEGIVCDVNDIQTGIKRPHDMDEFATTLKKEIFDIYKKHENAQFLINLTSGTQQIGAALRLIAVTGNKKVIALEVDTHEQGSNRESIVGDKYDIQEEFENNVDNFAEAANRCRETDLIEFRKTLLISKIVEEVKSYNYNSAFMLADQDELDAIDKDSALYRHLEMAHKRINFQLHYIKANREKYAEFPSVFSVKHDDVFEVFEYYLKLKVKFQKREYADGVLLLSPILKEFCQVWLRKEYGFDIKKITITEKAQNREMLDYDKAKKYCPACESLWEKIFKANSSKKVNSLRIDITAYNLLNIVKEFNEKELNEKREKVTRYLEMLREVESKIRNFVAHDFMEISTDTFQKKCNISTKDFINIIEDAFLEIYHEYITDQSAFLAYESLNKLIVDECNKFCQIALFDKAENETANL